MPLSTLSFHIRFDQVINMWRFLQGVEPPEAKKAKTTQDKGSQEKAHQYKATRKRTFQTHWKKERPWLIFDEKNGSSKCSACLEFDRGSARSSFATDVG